MFVFKHYRRWRPVPGETVLYTLFQRKLSDSKSAPKSQANTVRYKAAYTRNLNFFKGRIVLMGASES